MVGPEWWLRLLASLCDPGHITTLWASYLNLAACKAASGPGTVLCIPHMFMTEKVYAPTTFLVLLTGKA